MASNRLKQTILALALGSATVALGGAAVSTAAAQQAPETSTQQRPGGDRQALHEQLWAAVANKLNVSPDQLKQAFEDARKEIGLPDQQNGPGGPRRGGMGPGFEAAVKAIGISLDQLRQELPGKSLADVANAHNVDPATVASALKAEAETRIDQAVSAGRISDDQAAQMKQGLSARIDQTINHQGPTGGPRAADAGPGQGGPGMGHRGVGPGMEQGGGPGMDRFGVGQMGDSRI
jgi:hypothetical protein